MTRVVSILVAGVTLAATIGMASAEEPGAAGGTPTILASLESTAYRQLSQKEMAGVVGTLVPIGTYTVSRTASGVSSSGTAVIANVPSVAGLYSIKYTIGGQPYQLGYGFEYPTGTFSTVSVLGGTAYLATYYPVSSSSSSLNGQWTTNTGTVIGTDTLTQP